MLLKSAKKKKVIFSKILTMTSGSSFTRLRLSSRELLLTGPAKHRRAGQILIFSPGPWSSWAPLPLYHGPFGGRHPVSQFRTAMKSPRPQRPLHSYSSKVSPSWDIWWPMSPPYAVPATWILQARILKWVAFPFSRGSSQPRDQTQVSRIVGRFFTNWATRKVQTLAYISFNPPTDKATEAHHVWTGKVFERGPAFLTRVTCKVQSCHWQSPPRMFFPMFPPGRILCFLKAKPGFLSPWTFPRLQSTGLVLCLPLSPELLQGLFVTVLITCFLFTCIFEGRKY